MDTFCIDYLLKRIFGVGTPIDCQQHVFGKEVAGRFLFVPMTTRWFKKCAKCQCRLVYSDMLQCFECQGYMHEDCVSWASEPQEKQQLSTVHSRTVTLVDASTSTETPATDVQVVISTQCSASVVIDQDVTIATVDDAIVDTTTTETSAIGLVDVATAMDCDQDLATADLVMVDGTVLPIKSCIGVDDEVSWTQATARAVRNEDVDRSGAAAGLSDVPQIAAATVTPVSRLDITRANDSKDTLEQWTKRFEQFSKFDQGVMADRESLFSGPPEVLAKRFADQHRNFNTVIDPFCGAGATAIQMAMVCRKVIAMDSDPMNIKLAKHNARLYGVEKNIKFMIGDFFERVKRLRADAIVTTPPVEFSVGEGNMKIAALMKLSSGVAQKLLFRLPTEVDRAELYRWGSKHFSYIKFEEVCVDGVMNCVNFHLGHTTKNKSYGSKNNAAVKAETRILLYNERLAGDRFSNFDKKNDLYSYDLYLKNVEDFMERQIH